MSKGFLSKFINKPCTMKFFFIFLLLVAGRFGDVLKAESLVSSSDVKHRITIVDKEGETIPYIHAVFSGSDRYVLSNEAGVLSFSEEELALGGYLVFNSAFYQEKRISVDSLIHIDRVVLESPLLDEVTVVAKGYLEKEMEKVARYFREHYAKDYVATITIFYTVECHGKYREFMGYHGLFRSSRFTQKAPNIFFNDPNGMCGIEPLTIMRSDRLLAESDEILEPRVVVSRPPQGRKPQSLKIEYYDNRRNVEPLYAKRGFEIYSPLNEKRIKYYDYIRQAGYTSPEGEVAVIKFRTKPDAFPKKTRLYGEAEIHYLKDTYRIVRIVTENLQDLYSITPRMGVTELLPSATTYRFTVRYGERDGKIYTESVERSVNWIELNFSEGDFYRINMQPRRNPGKHHTKEYFYARFSDIVLSEEKLKTLKKFMYHKYSAIPYTSAPFEQEWWGKQTMPGIDKEKLFRDLHVNGRDLYRQAEENGMKSFNDEAFSPKDEEYKMRYKNIQNVIYPYIYEKQFK